jgi:hypothetical protein
VQGDAPETAPRRYERGPFAGSPALRLNDRAEGTAMASVLDPLWYKDAVIYQMHLKAFHDANDDSIR